MRVKKYNRKYEEFDKSKIVIAINAASNDTENESIPIGIAERIADSIEAELLEKDVKTITIDDISKIVEDRLMQTSYKEVAKSYITFHHEKRKEQIYNSDLIKAFKKKFNAVDVEKSNASTDERSFSGRMNEAAKILFKDEALNSMSKIHRDNHNNNEIYIHDLDSYAAGMSNCLSIPFDNMFENGVSIKQADIRSPKSIGSAFQLIAVYMQIQSLQQFGGVSATHIDWSLVPSLRWSFFKHFKDGLKYMLSNNDYKRFMSEDINSSNDEVYTTLTEDQIENLCKKFNLSGESSIDDEAYKRLELVYNYAIDMTNKETRQGAESLIHNLNSLQSRSGQQLPFSSINYGTCTLPEGRMIIKALLDAALDGTGPLHKTPIFPCVIFQWDKDINGYPGTPNYDLFKKAIYCTTKRFYPNYANVNWTTDVNGRMLDIEHKRKVLSKLSEDKMSKLATWVSKNKEEATKYKMVLDNNMVVIDENIINPVEIMSTMGKCKLQLI